MQKLSSIEKNTENDSCPKKRQEKAEGIKKKKKKNSGSERASKPLLPSLS